MGFFCVTWWWRDCKINIQITLAMIYVDLLVQLTICYICVTMGSSKQLNRFNCTMVMHSDGIVRILIKSRDSTTRETFTSDYPQSNRISEEDFPADLEETMIERAVDEII